IPSWQPEAAALEEEGHRRRGFSRRWGVLLAPHVSEEQRWEEGLGKAYGVESHVLSPAETKALYPLMNVDDLYGTLYVPHDGTMDPAGTCTALTRAAAARGAQVPKAPRVRLWADGSEPGACFRFLWASAVGRMAGVKVPLVAMHHAYVVTERIEGIQNMPNVRDHDASVYLRLQGDALSVGGYETNPIFWEEVRHRGIGEGGGSGLCLSCGDVKSQLW
uniref:FAD dependent oxidoreductase domain-containing protein n=1 Tax=Panthera tigris altaica TaxID=74533 RepID=A0A8C9M7U1_PANTA